MNHTRTLILPKDAYYAPTPMLTVDAAGCIMDFNVAFEVLFGSENAVFRHQRLADLHDGLQARAKGNFLPHDLLNDGPYGDEDTSRTSAVSYFESGRFGGIDFRLTVVHFRQGHQPGETRITMSWNVLRVANDEPFHQTLQAEWDHRLTWESYAASYDRVLPILPFYQEVVERHVEAMSAAGMDAVLDIGGGTGNVTQPLLDGRRRVTILDLSRAMLDKFRAKLPSPPPAELTILEQNAERIFQCPDDCMDGVTILLALYDMNDPRSALNEAARVLKPGGTLITTEPRACFELQSLLRFAEEFFETQGVGDSLRADWDRVTRANRVLDPRTHANRLSAEEIQADLTKRGFECRPLRDSHLGNCATLVARKPLRP